MIIRYCVLLPPFSLRGTTRTGRGSNLGGLKPQVAWDGGRTYL